MFLRNDHGFDQAGGTAAIPFGRAIVPVADLSPLDKARAAIARIDWAPDLGTQIGSATWWRGLATCAALCAATWMLSPGLDRTVPGAATAALAGSEWQEARAQSIEPLAWGAGSGRRMAANDLVAPLTETPERPIIRLTAALGDDDDFTRMLERAGVSNGDAAQAAKLVSGAVPLASLRPGTQIDMTLGRRPNRNVPRPLEKLAFRARFDLDLSLARAGQALAMTELPIAIDHTPLRIEGLVGPSLYRSARAAGAPAKAVESYIKAIASKLSIGRDVSAGDTFDLVIERARAATGETQLGDLAFAGLDQGARKTQLVRWGGDGHAQWLDSSGRTEQQGAMGMPVAGAITSGFGMRFHPILHFMRMHAGIDIGAPWGSPIHAAIDGIVSFAGRSGGYGNFVKLSHAGNLQTGYGHMSRIAVRPGEHVSRGDVIGYVGSTGLSTGPHLHWEVWKNGVSIDPRSVSLSRVTQLSGEALQAFRARLAGLLAVKAGGR